MNVKDRLVRQLGSTYQFDFGGQPPPTGLRSAAYDINRRVDSEMVPRVVVILWSLRVLVYREAGRVFGL